MLLDDPAATAGLVTREVRTGRRDGEPTRIAVAHRTYATDRADLWEAVTDPDRLPRWFLPVEGDLRPGGQYQFEGNAGGTIERCVPPEELAVTWEYGDMLSWLVVRLHEGTAGTRLELEHEAPVDPDMWEQFGPGAVGVGWDLALMGLGLHLQTGEPADPEAGATFPLTPEGHTFVRRAAEDWAAAATADGDSADVASAAGERTVAFYTTSPDGE